MPTLGPKFPENDRGRHPAPFRHQFGTKIRSGANSAPKYESAPIRNQNPEGRGRPTRDRNSLKPIVGTARHQFGTKIRSGANSAPKYESAPIRYRNPEGHGDPTMRRNILKSIGAPIRHQFGTEIRSGANSAPKYDAAPKSRVSRMRDLVPELPGIDTGRHMAPRLQGALSRTQNDQMPMVANPARIIPDISHR